jgi:FixJ family two-component response regulator
MSPEVTTNLISVVDDDESVRRSTRLLVESFGYRAAVFESAEGLLRFGQLQDTSCLVLDVQMPGMDGLELQTQLAAVGCGIPVIFITAHDDQESRRRALRSGAVAFLGKPFTDQQLLQAISFSLAAR